MSHSTPGSGASRDSGVVLDTGITISTTESFGTAIPMVVSPMPFNRRDNGSAAKLPPVPPALSTPPPVPPPVVVNKQPELPPEVVAPQVDTSAVEIAVPEVKPIEAVEPVASPESPPLKIGPPPTPKIEPTLKSEPAPKIDPAPQVELTPKIDPAPKADPTPKIEIAPTLKSEPPTPAVDPLELKLPVETKPFESADFLPELKPLEESPEYATAGAQFYAWVVRNTWHRYGPACTVSAIIHLSLLILLGLIFIPGLVKDMPTELFASVDADSESENVVQEFTPTQEQTESASSSESMAKSMASVDAMIGANGAVESMATPAASVRPTEQASENQVNIAVETVFQTNNRVLGKTLPKGMLGDPLAFANNNSEAVDRIGREIAGKMAQGKVLIIWCFDQSESMKDDRAEIISRVNAMYDEMLSKVDKNSSDAVLSVVTSYGEGFSVQTPTPTKSLETIKEAMAAVPVDPSGMENQCSAVAKSIASYHSMAKSTHRKMMMVLCTDESGNPPENMAMLETAIAEAKAVDCPIYVIGREAVFGYPYAHMNWSVTITIPGTDQKISRHFVLPIDRGPETPFVEQLQTDGFGIRRDAHPSGFGAYEQARMARETGGIFFLLPSPEIGLFHRDTRKYDPQKMRAYMPDLGSRVDYIAERDKSPLRSALWQVINDMNPYLPNRTEVLTYSMEFSANPEEFVKQVRHELENAKMCFTYMTEAEKRLREIERERSREAVPRWQANYDLIFAQLLAYRVRLYEYGAYLELFIEHPKAVLLKPRQYIAAWRIQSRKETITGELTAGLIKESISRFREVINLHPGTPWAARAQDELDRGFGIELYPVIGTIPAPGGPVAGPPPAPRGPVFTIPTPKL